ncbi:TetR/AcrR family transcriptional regulator [Spelaeicoccus albus]|nr:TetR/AcrR family transcriptional regulator [Spelaeicoccus albus]
MPPATNRAPRKDVARNRQLLLDAGRHVFAERGLDATLDDIAHSAGVGAGTAYRHFGSRQGIIDAIFSDVAHSFIDDAEHALTIDDPWRGFVTFVERLAERQAADRGLYQVFTGQSGGCISREDWQTLSSSITAVADRAKESGVLRDDVGLSDVVGLFSMLGPVYDLSTATATPIWRRHIDIFLRGVRTDAPHGSIAAPPGLSADAISLAMGIQ